MNSTDENFDEVSKRKQVAGRIALKGLKVSEFEKNGAFQGPLKKFL